MNARPTLLGSNNKRPKNPTRGEGGGRKGRSWHAAAGRGFCSPGSQSTWNGARKRDGPLLTDFKFQTSSKYVGFFNRTKIKSAQGAEVSKESNSSDSGFPTTTQFYLSSESDSTCRQFWQASLSERLIQANLVLRFGTFARAGICHPTETGASSAGTLHWPSWRHTSSCLLRKARANTGIFSHMIQSQTTPGDVYRSDPFLPQSRRRFQNSTEHPPSPQPLLRPTATPSSCPTRYSTFPKSLCPQPPTVACHHAESLCKRQMPWSLLLCQGSSS